MHANALIVAIGVLAACNPAPRDRAHGSDSTRVDSPSPAPDPTAHDASVVSFSGTRGFEPGMSLTDARARIPGLQVPAAAVEGCDYARAGEGDDQLTFLIVDDKLARVDVGSAAYTTDRGIRIGDTEDKVKSAYGANVIVQPHKYTSGRYLIVNNPADTMIALVFETDSTSNITRYRLGTKPVVHWVEGCS